jgi:hypothetical protein
LTEPTQLGNPFASRSARHETSLNIRNSWQDKKTPNKIRADIDNNDLQASFEVAAKIRDYVLLEATYIWEEKAPKVALALLELVSSVSDTIHANIPKIEQWENNNGKEQRTYSLVHCAKEISQNHTEFFLVNGLYLHLYTTI